MLARGERLVAQVAQAPPERLILERTVLRRIPAYQHDTPLCVDSLVVVDGMFLGYHPPAGKDDRRRDRAAVGKARHGVVFGGEIFATHGKSRRRTPFHRDHGPETLTVTAVSGGGFQTDQRVLLFKPGGCGLKPRRAETAAAAVVVGKPGDVSQVTRHGGLAVSRPCRRTILGVGGR